MATYNITNLVLNITSGNKTITIEADEGYSLPSSVSVSDGTLVSYNSSTGVAVVSGDNVVVSATCEISSLPYLTFSSLNTFTLNVVDNQKYWDGILQYSTDTTAWNTWDGATTLSSSDNGVTKYLYLRGIGNTYITGSSATLSKGRWVLTGNNIDCTGNIETLLDYAMVMNGQHPPMANYCYSRVFEGCSRLVTAPSLPATTLAYGCYQYIFHACTSLTTAPSLPATVLADYCYHSMFDACTGLITPPSLPATTLADYCYDEMFRSCTSLTVSAIMGDGTTQLTMATHCCELMYYGCTSLETAPSLPATVLADYCYYSMFHGCTGLITPPSLPATTLANCCYQYMFRDCTSLITPAIMGDGTTQLTAVKRCCANMYYNCTSLNIYTTSTSHTPFYKAMAYSTISTATDYRSTDQMFYNCKIDNVASTADYITAGTQLYY